MLATEQIKELFGHSESFADVKLIFGRQVGRRPKSDWNRRRKFGKLRGAPLRASNATYALCIDLSPRFFRPGAIDADSPQITTTTTH
jgi:hypothetical protein